MLKTTENGQTNQTENRWEKSKNELHIKIGDFNREKTMKYKMGKKLHPLQIDLAQWITMMKESFPPELLVIALINAGTHLAFSEFSSAEEARKAIQSIVNGTFQEFLKQ